MARSLLAGLLLMVLTICSQATAQPLSAPPPLPAPSPDLLDILGTARFGPMTQLIAWANGMHPSDASGGPLETLESRIMSLAPADRDALLYWLQSHGRGALHARGLSDAAIGPAYFPIDYSVVPGPWPQSVVPLTLPRPAPLPTPTPPAQHHSSFLSSLANVIPDVSIPIASSSTSSTTSHTNSDGSQTTTTESSGTYMGLGVDTQALLSSLADAAQSAAQSRPETWRGLLFAASMLESPGDPSQVSVTRGFAATRANGTQGVVCISFVNEATLPATEIDFDLALADAYGFVKRVLALRRVGSYSSGVEVAGPKSVADAQSARANCVVDGEGTLDDPTDPFAGASAVLYTVRQVKYADGSSWLLPGANPWPELLR